MKILDIFCTSAKEDEKMVNNFKKHLVPFKSQNVRVWFSHDVPAGTEWERERGNRLSAAHIILLLISPSFMASPECEREALLAMDRYERGEAYVIPIILRDVDWQDASFGDLLPLPGGGKPVSDPSWSTQDAAFFNIVEGIKLVIGKIRDRSGDTQPSSLTRPVSSDPSPGMTNSEISKALFEQFMKKQYNRALKHYRERSDHHIKVWKTLQWTLVCLAVAVAILVGAILFASTSSNTLLQLLLACLVFLLSLVLVLVAIILVTSYSHEKWIVYNRTVNDLEKEHDQYLYGRGYEVELYAQSTNKERLFMERVLSIIENARQVANPTRWGTMRDASLEE